jgi:hypothetical protein
VSDKDWKRPAVKLWPYRRWKTNDAQSAVEQAAAKIVEAVIETNPAVLPHGAIVEAAGDYRVALARLAELKGGGA